MMDYTVSMSPVQRGDPASSCIGCGECLAKCPQQLDIPNLLPKVQSKGNDGKIIRKSGTSVSKYVIHFPAAVRYLCIRIIK